MKTSKTVTEIVKEIEKVELELNSREKYNKLRITRLIGKKEGLNLALEIIASNM